MFYLSLIDYYKILSIFPCAIYYVLVGHLFYIQYYVYINPTLLIYFPLICFSFGTIYLFSMTVIYFCFAYKFICIIFLDFIYCCLLLRLSVMSNPLQPYGLQPARLLHPQDSPGKNTGVGCHFLLQGIFPTPGSNPGLLHRQTDSLPGKPISGSDRFIYLTSVC